MFYTEGPPHPWNHPNRPQGDTNRPPGFGGFVNPGDYPQTPDGQREYDRIADMQRLQALHRTSEAAYLATQGYAGTQPQPHTPRAPLRKNGRQAPRSEYPGAPPHRHQPAEEVLEDTEPRYRTLAELQAAHTRDVAMYRAARNPQRRKNIAIVAAAASAAISVGIGLWATNGQPTEVGTAGTRITDEDYQKAIEGFPDSAAPEVKGQIEGITYYSDTPDTIQYGFIVEECNKADAYDLREGYIGPDCRLVTVKASRFVVDTMRVGDMYPPNP